MLAGRAMCFIRREWSVSLSCSLGQVGASAKEVSHKAEATIPGNAASIHAEGLNGASPLAGKTTHQRLNCAFDQGRAESRRLEKDGGWGRCDTRDQTRGGSPLSILAMQALPWPWLCRLAPTPGPIGRRMAASKLQLGGAQGAMAMRNHAQNGSISSLLCPPPKGPKGSHPPCPSPTSFEQSFGGGRPNLPS